MYLGVLYVLQVFYFIRFINIVNLIKFNFILLKKKMWIFKFSLIFIQEFLGYVLFVLKNYFNKIIFCVKIS